MALLLSSVLTIATARLDRSVTVKLGSIHVESDARRERTLPSDTSHAHIHRGVRARVAFTLRHSLAMM
jgi:hypothetical protein